MLAFNTRRKVKSLNVSEKEVRGKFRGSYFARGRGYRARRDEIEIVGRKPNLPIKFKVAVASQRKGGLDDLVSPTFGRCPVFTIIEVEDNRILRVDVVENIHSSESRGAGIATAQMLNEFGVNVVIAGRFGPNAYNTLNYLGISAFTVPSTSTVKEAVEKLIL